MKKRTATLLIILLIVLIGGGIYWYFTLTGQSEERGEREGQDFNLPSFEEDMVGQGGDGGMEGDESEGFTFSAGVAPYQRLANNVAGAVTLDDSEATSSIRLIRRDSGHVYEAFIRDEIIRLTNTTIPRVQEVKFSPDGENLILQYLDEARENFRTYLGSLVENTEGEEDQTPFRISGSFLPNDIVAYDFSPDNAELFYIRTTTTGSEGIIYSLLNDTSEIIFTSEVSKWDVDWIANATIALQTKSSGVAEGYLYFLSTSGTLSRVLGEHNGLTTLVHPSLDTIFYSDSRGTITSYVYNQGERETTQLSIKTLAEKCVWSTEEENILFCAVPQTLSGGTYPDVWYRGDISFNDSFWRINTATGREERIASPSDFEEDPVDAVDLQLIEEDEFLIFRNKKDGSLWSLRL
ncbi:MAG: hypothetical protein WDZ70_00320 [Candidatus Paceibacterota bacterium]